MLTLKHALTTTLAAAAFLLVLPATAQTGGTPALLPPDQLFTPPAPNPQPGQPPGKFQSLYNDASLCSGLAAKLQGNAGVFAARALTESTRARRAGDEQAAVDLEELFNIGTTLRTTTGSAHQTLESFRTELARLNSVSDAGGRILFIAGGRRVMPLPLNNLPAGGAPLTDAMLVHATALLDSVEDVHTCLAAVGAVDISAP